MVIFVQVLFGISLFFLINWIGRHSFSIGYMQISMFLKEEESPAFNVIFRILSPIVYLFILSAILYKLGLSRYVSNIYLVSVYYLSFRLLFNIITNRGRLLNWTRLISQWVIIISLSYYCYDRIISTQTNLFPDFSTWSNEIWIIILIFLYSVFNNIKLSPRHTKRRKLNYLTNRYNFFKKRYGEVIKSSIENQKLESLIYAIMIYEDFNRPKLIRNIENISSRLTRKEHSLGLMQIKADKIINDEISLEIALKKIKKSYTTNKEKLIEQSEKRIEERKKNNQKLMAETGIYILKDYIDENGERSDWELVRGILKDYNPDQDYISEVTSLQSTIEENFGYNKSNSLWD